MSDSDWLTLAGIVALLCMSAVLAMAETAFVRINRIRAMTLLEEGRKGAERLLKLMEQPETALNLVLLLVLICQLTAATLVGVLVERKLGGYGLLAGTAIEIVAFFVLAEVAPKTYAIQHTETAALRLSGLLWALTRFPPLRHTDRPSPSGRRPRTKTQSGARALNAETRRPTGVMAMSKLRRNRELLDPLGATEVPGVPAL